MKPVKSLRLLIGTLLAADASTLAPAADANKVALVKELFSEDEETLLGDLVLADFDGSTPIEGAIGSQQVATDPNTGDQVITVKDPLGGYRWTTTGLTNLPQTIYGFALLNNAGNALLGVELLDEPVTLDEVGQEINLGRVTMRVVQSPLS